MSDVATLLDTAWGLLAGGAGDRHSPVHTPVVASVDAAGRPDARVMVLREADRAAARLRFHTDARAPKLAALDDGPVAVLAYHAAEKWQLRIAGHARRLRDEAEVDAIWQAATLFARRCYLAEAAPGTALPGPGSGLPAWVEGRAPTPEEVVPARANFAVLHVSVTAIDMLHLANSGHRRFRLTRTGDGWAGGWLVP